jgi:putative aminopeptidase FrvX
MIAHRIKPNIAIITDVTHDTQTPMISKITQGDLACGKGPVVSYAPAVQTNLNKLLIKAAEANNIPFQRQASSRSTGTDTDAFAYSNDGVISALISLPLRYMHTTVEMIHKEDVDNVIRLIYESLLSIQVDQDFRSVK